MKVKKNQSEEILDLPFDQYQRYRITTEIIRVIKNGKAEDKLSILDVGGCANHRDGKGYFLPISLFLSKESLTVVDVVNFKDPIYVKSEGGSLPFPDSGFDVIVCNDVLEHIKPLMRKTFINDLIRVSKIAMILATPHKTKVNNLAERYLFHFIQERLGLDHEQLKEHIDHGLPERKKIEEMLKCNGMPFFSFPAGNTYYWFIMMVLKHHIAGLPDSRKLHRKIDRFYNESFWEDFWPTEAYRCFYVLLKEASGSPSLIENVETRFSPHPWSIGKIPEERDPDQFFCSILDMIREFHEKTCGIKYALTSALKSELFQRWLFRR